MTSLASSLLPWLELHVSDAGGGICVQTPHHPAERKDLTAFLRQYDPHQAPPSPAEDSRTEFQLGLGALFMHR
jgi:hypothetical protein